MAKGQTPTHNLVSVHGEGEKARYTQIAALWPTKRGDGGLTGEIPQGITITGRVLVQPVKGDHLDE